jgi:hypothetical protein
MTGRHDIKLLGDFRAQYLTNAAWRLYSAQAALCFQRAISNCTDAVINMSRYLAALLRKATFCRSEALAIAVDCLECETKIRVSGGKANHSKGEPQMAGRRRRLCRSVRRPCYRTNPAERRFRAGRETVGMEHHHSDGHTAMGERERRKPGCRDERSRGGLGKVVE